MLVPMIGDYGNFKRNKCQKHVDDDVNERTLHLLNTFLTPSLYLFNKIMTKMNFRLTTTLNYHNNLT